jgi:hypothetical protein
MKLEAANPKTASCFNTPANDSMVNRSLDEIAKKTLLETLLAHILIENHLVAEFHTKN